MLKMHILIFNKTNVCLQATVPRWQVHNEAALFWRATGNGSRALQCLRQALSSAPPSNRHLSLNNAANLLIHYSLTTHAQTLLEQALSLNATEVRSQWCRTLSGAHTFKLLAHREERLDYIRFASEM